METVRLGVNVDHIATVRQARRGVRPDPIEAARVCERAGAKSIVCHLREDRRHIQDEDVRRLRAVVTTRLNLEMSVAEEIIEVALAIRPDQVSLVPERRQELTTEGGLDVVRLSNKLKGVVERLQARGIQVSVFIDPSLNQVQAARDIGATVVELHTGRYADTTTLSAKSIELSALAEAARVARRIGLAVAAGHGLEYDNVRSVVEIAEVEELNIGFSIIARALSVGLERAVKDMVELMTPRKADALQAA